MNQIEFYQILILTILQEFPIQINGKLKCCITVDADENGDKILEIIKNSQQVKDIFEKNEVIKEIYVPGKIYNLVVKK